jgi:hypothetical protein
VPHDMAVFAAQRLDNFTVKGDLMPLAVRVPPIALSREQLAEHAPQRANSSSVRAIAASMLGTDRKILWQVIQISVVSCAPGCE